MKLALVTLDYPPAIGGIARYLWNLVKAAGGSIEAFAHKGYRGNSITADLEDESLAGIQQPSLQQSMVLPWILGPQTAPLTFYLPKRISLLRRGPLGWTPAIRFIHALRHQGYGLVLVSHVLPIGTAAWIARMFGGLEYGVIIHGLDLRLAQRSWRKNLLTRFILRKAKIVLANSQFTAKEIRSFDARLEPVVMTPGVEPLSFLSRKDARTYVGALEEDFIILTVTRLVARKGIDTMIRVLADLPSRVHYVIIGDGPDWERLEEMARPYGNRVRLLTRVRDEERNAWYAAADLFALLSRDAGNDVEGFGIVCLEAALVNVPVIAGRSGGLPEAIEDQVTGKLVDPMDMQEVRKTVEFFLEHPEEGRRMGEAGKKRAEQQFQWEDRWKMLAACVGVGMQPLVSVIIPVYDHIDELKHCLQALEHQTYRSLEVIIVDDGSEEPVIRQIGGMRMRFPSDIRRFEQNKGAPAARNEGFRWSHGAYVLFLDADAELEPEAIESMACILMTQTDVDFAYGDFCFGGVLFHGKPWDPVALRERNFIHTSSLLRRASFPGFDESLKRFQDWDLWLTLAERGCKGKWIPRKLMRMRQRKTGMSRWVPSIIHRVPWHKIGWMPKELQRYREAEAVIREKHGI